jgi:hypothetical protein
MTPESQRIAIAEACGWKWEKLWTGEFHGKPIGEQGPFRELPDYLNDLNAMHEAEKTLTKDQSRTYACRKLSGGIFDAVHATAAQRAEAFLHTIGKWVSK